MIARPVIGYAALVLVLLGTSACVRIGAKPPEQLLSINTESRLATGTPQSAAAQSALFVELPDVPRTLATQRVAVRATANSFAYVPKALWADTPARQFQALLGETIAVRTGRLVLDPGQYLAQTNQILHGDLIEFGVDAGSNKAVVTFDASLLGPDGQTVRRQRFSASQPVTEIDGDHVAAPISKAANEVAGQIADWIGKP